MRIPVLVFALSSAVMPAQEAQTRLQGGGIEVALDLTGFKQDAGLTKFHDNYFSLGQFSSADELTKGLGNRLIVSVLVDELPKQVEGDPFRLGYSVATKNGAASIMGSNALPGATMTIERLESPKGVLFSYPQVTELSGRKLYQLHLYIVTILSGKWVELHFSVPSDAPVKDPAPLRAKVKAIAASISIPQPAPNK